MTSDNFDASLASYKPQAQSEAIAVVEMCDQFTQQKQRTISIGPLTKYLSLQQHVLAFFKGKTTVSIAVLKKVRYARCPMPDARCPMPDAQSYLIFLRKAISPLSIAEKFRAYLAQKLEPGFVLTAKG